MIKAVLLGHLTWNIPLLILLIIVFIFYVVIVFHNKPIKLLQPILFISGLCLLYFSIGSPLLAISYLSFSLHMIQMSILYFIIPPFILLGIPSYVYKYILNLQFTNMLNRYYKPKVSLIIFSSLFLMYHLPLFLTYITKQPVFQTSFLTVLFILSFHMWVPITSHHTTRGMSDLTRKKYIFYSGLLITPACILFIVTALFNNGENPLFSDMLIHLCLPPEASTVKVLPPPFNTKYDQMMAGVFMMGLHKLSLVVTCKLEKKCTPHHSQNNQII